MLHASDQREQDLGSKGKVATVSNRVMANATGIDTKKTDRLTFAIGCGIAGIAGAAFTTIGSTGPDSGSRYIVDAFLVVVSGGKGRRGKGSASLGGWAFGTVATSAPATTATSATTFAFDTFSVQWEHRRFAGNNTDKGENVGCYFYGTKGIFHMGWQKGWTFYPSDARQPTITMNMGINGAASTSTAAAAQEYQATGSRISTGMRRTRQTAPR